jgi:hypothetical protein
MPTTGRSGLRIMTSWLDSEAARVMDSGLRVMAAGALGSVEPPAPALLHAHAKMAVKRIIVRVNNLIVLQF